MSSLASRIRFALPTLVLTASTGACGPLLLDPDEVEFRDSLGCAACPPNSPRINDAPIQQLRLSGLPNDEGVSLLGLRRNAAGPLHTVTTDDHEDLVAVLDGVVIASGADLEGWELVVEFEGEERVATISVHDPAVALLADAGRPATAYAIKFPTTADGEPVHDANVCPTWLSDPYEPVVTVIRGETYELTKKLVDSTDPDWITLACADQAAYKTKLLGYGPMSAFGPATPAFSVAERNATLKMITADYCGTGHSFTEQSEGVYYLDEARTVTAYEYNAQLAEAVWTADGALCIDFPRAADRADVIAECPLPYCGGIDLEQPGIVWHTGVSPY